MLIVWGLWSALSDFTDRPEAVDAERKAIHRLSLNLRAHPNTPVRIDFHHDGSTAGGIFGHRLFYDPRKFLLQDWSEYSPQLWLELAALRPDQIHQVANSGGSFNELARQKGVRLLYENPGRARYGTPLWKKPKPKGHSRKPAPATGASKTVNRSR